MDFYKIKNNTNNSITINGVYIEPNNEAIFSQEMLSLIDNQYFDSGILINNGVVKVDDNIVILNTDTKGFYRKPASGIPKTHLDKMVLDSLRKADLSITKGNVESSDLNSDLRSIIENIPSEEELYDYIESVLFKETELNTTLNKKLELIKEEIKQYYKKPASGIPKTHLDKETKDLLSKAGSSISKGNVNILDLNDDLKSVINKIPTIESIKNQIDATTIKENQLEPIVKEKLKTVVDLNNKIYEQKINYDDLTPDVQYLLEQNSSEASSYWKTPVSTKELLPLDNNRDNDIRLVLEDNSLWRWDNSNIWLKLDQTVETPSSGNEAMRDIHVIGEFFARKGQVIFKSQRPYVKGNHDLQVTLNGLLMMLDEDYIEVDDYTIQFNGMIYEDDYIIMSKQGSSANASVSIENIIINTTGRYVKLNLPYRMNENSLRVYLNGVLVSQDTSSSEGDYIEFNTDTIKFNYDLVKDDKVIIRRESTFSSDIIKDNFNSMQKVYLNLSKQIDLLKNEIRMK